MRARGPPQNLIRKPRLLGNVLRRRVCTKLSLSDPETPAPIPKWDGLSQSLSPLRLLVWSLPIYGAWESTMERILDLAAPQYTFRSIPVYLAYNIIGWSQQFTHWESSGKPPWQLLPRVEAVQDTVGIVARWCAENSKFTCASESYKIIDSRKSWLVADFASWHSLTCSTHPFVFVKNILSAFLELYTVPERRNLLGML